MEGMQNNTAHLDPITSRKRGVIWLQWPPWVLENCNHLPWLIFSNSNTVFYQNLYLVHEIQAKWKNKIIIEKLQRKCFIIAFVDNVILWCATAVFYLLNIFLIIERDNAWFLPFAPLQIAFTFLVYPALILAYMGQAAYLSKHHDTSYHISYYVSVPGICFCHSQEDSLLFSFYIF